MADGDRDALLDGVRERYTRLLDEVHRVIIGQDEVVRNLVSALFARGHCLLIGVPGLAKTLLVKTLAQSLSWEFKRIQFTPDLMPSDIIGTRARPQSSLPSPSPGRRGTHESRADTPCRNRPTLEIPAAGRPAPSIGHQHLAVRAGSYRARQGLLRERREAAPPAFDPGAPTATRKSELQRWLRWWTSRGERIPGEERSAGDRTTNG